MAPGRWTPVEGCSKSPDDVSDTSSLESLALSSRSFSFTEYHGSVPEENDAGTLYDNLDDSLNRKYCSF